MTELPSWSSDVPISVPQPPPNPSVIPMFGFGMSWYGLVHDITDVEFERLRRPNYAPDMPTSTVVRDDAEFD
jgi:hypothetical protein